MWVILFLQVGSTSIGLFPGNFHLLVVAKLSTILTSHGPNWTACKTEIQQYPWIQAHPRCSQWHSYFIWVYCRLRRAEVQGVPGSSQGGSLITTLLHEYHNSSLGGHFGVYKTHQRFASDWFWRNMRKDVETYVQSQSTCQQLKTSSLSPAGLL